jgi:hypothetical protein
MRERGLLEQAAKAPRVPRPSLLRRVMQLGRSYGALWSQDENFATLAAWMALSVSTRTHLINRNDRNRSTSSGALCALG